MKRIIHYKNHTLNYGYVKKLDTPIYKKLVYNKPIPLSHLTSQQHDSNDKSKIFRILPDNLPRMQYKEDIKYKSSLHWGQLKLMLTEIEFLTLVIEDHKKNFKNKKLTVVYPGAAPGDHIELLARLFPTMTFVLYDLVAYSIKATDKIILKHQFFTDIDAQEWNSAKDTNYIAVISDIRTMPVSHTSIKEDMDRQLGWWKIMNPHMTIYKFRLQYDNNKTEYPKGDIYIQPFARILSSETRLIIKENAPLIQYDNKKYEEQMFTYNSKYRDKYYNHALGDVNIRDDGIDNCYDCSCFVLIIEKYLKSLGETNNSQLLINIKKYIREIPLAITFGKTTLGDKTEAFNRVKFEDIINICQNKCGKNNCTSCNKYFPK